VWQDDQHRPRDARSLCRPAARRSTDRHGGKPREREELRRGPARGVLRIDGAYTEYDLFQEMTDLQCSFIGV